MRLRPIDDADKSVGKERDIESKFGRGRIGTILILGKQIEQKRSKLTMLKHLGDRSIAWTVSDELVQVVIRRRSRPLRPQPRT